MGGKTTEASLKYFCTILVDEGGGRSHQTLVFVLLTDGDDTGDGVSNVDRGGKLKLHSCGQETNHATNVRHHAGSEQTRNDASSKPGALNEGLVNVIWIIVAGDATVDGYISFGEGAAKGECLSHLHRVEGRL